MEYFDIAGTPALRDLPISKVFTDEQYVYQMVNNIVGHTEESTFADEFLWTFSQLLVGMMIGYFIAVTLAYVALYRTSTIVKLLGARKIQKEIVSTEMMLSECLWSIPTQFVGAAFIGMSLVGYVRGETRIYVDIAAFGWPSYVLSTIVMFLGNDAWMYWTHRAFHTPMLYRNIHKRHHLYKVPTPFATMASHPIESCVQFAMIGMLRWYPVHLPTLGLMGIGLFFVALMDHCGFAFDKYEEAVGGIFSTSLHHDLHHSLFMYNFGVYLSFWDRFCGTYYRKKTVK